LGKELVMKAGIGDKTRKTNKGLPRASKFSETVT
jgi:hypothetical protein